MKTKTKRVRAYVNLHDGGSNGDYMTIWTNKRVARNHAGYASKEIAVRVVELRKGEVVVDVEKLGEALGNSTVVRAALKKVGIR